MLEQTGEERADLLALLVADLLAEHDRLVRSLLGLRLGPALAALGLALLLFPGAHFLLQHLGAVNGFLLRLGALGLGLDWLRLRLRLTVVIADADRCGRAADAEEAGLRALEDLDGHIVALQTELLQCAADGLVLGLARHINKLDHLRQAPFRYSP